MIVYLFERFGDYMDWTFLYDYKWLIGSVALPIVIFFLGFLSTLALQFLSNLKYGKKYFRIIWRKACRLEPDDFLRGRVYYDFYLGRAEDKKIQELVKKKQNVLIVGRPLSGKTRAAYESIKKLKWWRDVLVAIPQDIELENFRLPKHFKFWRKRILFIDDLNIFVEKNNFEHVLYGAKEKGIPIVATCRSGEEYKKVEGKMADVNLHLESKFEDNIIELGTIEQEKGENIAKQVGKDWETVDFDGTIGSIFIPLSEMKNRFDNKCTSEERTILRVIKDMYDCGVFIEDFLFPVECIKTAAEKEGIEKKEYEWKELFERLVRWEFISIDGEYVKGEEVYLEKVVSSLTRMDIFSLMVTMIDSFNDIPNALVKLGNRAYDLGLYRIEKAKFMKIAIAAYDKALYFWTVERFPMQYGMTQNYLGNAYGTLSDVEDKRKNCRLAIGAYEEALKVWTIKRFQIYYAGAKNNLGNAYRILAEVEEKGENCRRAIGAYEEALHVWTLERFPMEYAMIQNNLGSAHGILAGVEEKGDNCRLAILACNEALQVRTLELFPMQYAMTQFNLGYAYYILAQVEGEDKVENCRRAIEACNEALKVRIKERFPMDYAETQNNLGATYQTLAGVEDTAANCHKAIGAYEEALQVRTLELFPIDYATTQNNLGNAYITLAKVEEKDENCRLGLKAFQEALKIFRIENLYEAVRIVEGNIILLKEFCKNLLY